MANADNIQMSAHARRRARRWAITEQELSEALGNRESERLGDQPGRLVVGITSIGWRLKIVVAVDDQKYVVTCAAQG